MSESAEGVLVIPVGLPSLDRDAALTQTCWPSTKGRRAVFDPLSVAVIIGAGTR